jgi:two-component system sensor histidine kinase KdpD
MKTSDLDQKDFLALLEQANRGRLKIYTGPVAGVGKTYRMLEEAHSLQDRGADVVLAYIETHGRKKIEAFLPGLELIPRKQYDYRGIVIEEMDLEAVLKRKPQIAIVDEAAHSNAPQCLHAKRYQDIIELLKAGINVICSFNIQHLESISDIVQKFTNIKIYETIPDSFLKRADQVINVDLGVEDIIERLQSGQIYAPENISQAMGNFFREENLSKLREIALREVAEVIEQAQPLPNHSLSLKKELFANNQIMVCLMPQARSQRTLFKKASRLAGRLNQPWFVVYPITAEDDPEHIDLEKQRYLFMDIQFAKDLGAHIVNITTTHRVKAWLDFAQTENISHIIIGRVKENWWRILFRMDTISSLVRGAKNCDIVIMGETTQEEPTL